MDADTKKYMIEMLKWLGIYFAIAIIVSIFLPFPYSLIVLVAIVMGLAYYRRRRFAQKMGAGSSSFFGGMFGSKGVDYYCLNCGTKHSQIACPKCGSKMKKAGF